MPVYQKRNNVATEAAFMFIPDNDRHKKYISRAWLGRGAVGAANIGEVFRKDVSLPVITSFVSNPSEIDEDASPFQNITLSWNSSGTVTNRRITDLHRHSNVPLRSGNSVTLARPLARTVYSLEMSNTFGTVSDRIVVPVFKDAVINSFTVQYVTIPLSPHNINVVYSFSVTAKPRPTITIDQGVGTIGESPSHGSYNADTGVWAGSVTHTYAGPRTFTATLTATNIQANGISGPTATATVNVTVP